jgi:RimJ/RimL family protein N-acetyltransferase
MPVSGWKLPWVSLAGPRVRLEPLLEAHAEALFAVGDDDDIWRFLPYGRIDSVLAMRRWIRMLALRRSRGTDIPFVIRHLAPDRIIGATRYLRLDPVNLSLEIGGTWFGAAYRGIGFNEESKLLLLEYAFEQLGCIRVQFRSDVRNLRSHRALEKLGAAREGVLRQEMLLPSGHPRDSVVFSILDREWPARKEALRARLSRSCARNEHLVVPASFR